MRAVSDFIIRRRISIVVFFALAVLVSAVLQSGVTTNYNIIDYLPQDAQSTRALSIMKGEFATATPNARVMLKDVTLIEALEYKHQLVAIDGVTDVLWLDDIVDLRVPLEMAEPGVVENYYKNGNALISLTIREGDEVEISNDIYELIGDANALSGAAAGKATMQNMTGNETRNAMLIVMPLIILILLFSTNSWLEPLLFLVAIGVSVVINMGTNLALGEISFVTKAVSPILQLAVSLDYAIFLLHSFESFREQTDDVKEAMQLAMTQAFPIIAASAATTLFGFMALVFMQFEIGADLGFNLAKGIIFSFISVMVFLPALAISAHKMIDRTRHKNFMPDFKGVGHFVYRARIPVLIIVVLLLVPSYLAQNRTDFIYGDSGMGENSRSGQDARVINEEFGESTAIVLLVPRGDVVREDLLSGELLRLDAITEVISYTRLVGKSIPAEFLDSSVAEQFYSEHYARLIVYTDTLTEGDRAFEVVEQVQDLARKHYGNEVYSTGQSVTLYDMKTVVERDNRVVNALAIGAIFMVLLVTFKSLSLPLVLLITIQTAIWINLAVPYFSGNKLAFVGYLIIGAVQLGATVDYAILLNSHYIANRKVLPKKAALYKTIEETIGSILVSASILALAGLALWITSSNQMVSELGLLLGRGTILSMLMVGCFLPAMLTQSDGFIEKTTHRTEFFRER